MFGDGVRIQASDCPATTDDILESPFGVAVGVSNLDQNSIVNLHRREVPRSTDR